MNNFKHIGALVDFDEKNVGVFVYSDCKGDCEKHGEILLISTYIMRVLSLVRNKTIKEGFLYALANGVHSAKDALPEYIKGYEDYYHLNNVGVIETASEKTKRGFTFIIPFNLHGHRTIFKPRGFGILGRNIEPAAITAVLMVIIYTANKYQGDNKMLEMINDIIGESVTVTGENRKIGVRGELDTSERLANKFFPLKTQ